MQHIMKVSSGVSGILSTWNKRLGESNKGSDNWIDPSKPQFYSFLVYNLSTSFQELLFFVHSTEITYSAANFGYRDH